MFSTAHFPRGHQVWHFATPVGTFWILPTPDRRFLWGIDGQTLGLAHHSAEILMTIRKRSTSVARWDLAPAPPAVPPLEEWACALGTGDFAYKTGRSGHQPLHLDSRTDARRSLQGSSAAAMPGVASSRAFPEKVGTGFAPGNALKY
jgi:hypothetical protein